MTNELIETGNSVEEIANAAGHWENQEESQEEVDHLECLEKSQNIICWLKEHTESKTQT